MFTGIIESVTEVYKLYYDINKNLHMIFTNPFNNKIKINQSISHNGICLTIVNIYKKNYSVTASKETLSCTNLNYLKIGDKVNLERSLFLKGRIEGHIVQGHIDTTAKIINILKKNGSWLFIIKFKNKLSNNVVKKGSIAINGVSLTVNDCNKYTVSVSIILYTYIKTNFQFLKIGDIVNIEFDILGKYINKFIETNITIIDYT
ncbi:riboflavin synthase [Blattabacterium cuenoti]|uniref:riboflavin synthase n=1 Tax=Blattabacterium cuenoti TaxID=1653831 RepID=UPI00163D34DB|nr:riboflavin synthase [Blattabacterium cuenoti]